MISSTHRQLALYLLLFALLQIGMSAWVWKDPALDYIKQYKQIAIDEMHRSGIPASIKLAQALIESESGKSELAINGNNHFGIKCGKSWIGKSYFKVDDDRSETGEIMESCFRAYAKPEDSFQAHTDFIKDPKKDSRYGFLFDLPSNDYKAWAYGLKDAGYATDPAYPDKLIRAIEKYELYYFDVLIKEKDLSTSSVKGKKSNADILIQHSENDNSKFDQKSNEKDKLTSPQKKSSRLKTEVKSVSSDLALKNIVINDKRAVVVPRGSSVTDIAASVGMTTGQLIAYNEILWSPSQVMDDVCHIFLERKNRAYYGTEVQHEVQEGETLESIANLYGIPASTLLQLNLIPKDHQPLKGEMINLKQKVERNNKPQTKKINPLKKFLFEL